MEGRHYIIPGKFSSCETLDVPSCETAEAFRELNDFISGYGEFTRLSLPRARGLLFYGSAGNAKTTTIRRLAREMVEKYSGVVFLLQNDEALASYANVFPTFRELEPERPVLTILEDIDKYYGDERRVSLLLNLLDGLAGTEHFFVATTNHIDKLDTRMLRAGRFDRRILFSNPDEIARGAFFKKMLERAGSSPSPEFKEWISGTEGFSYAMLREFVVLVLVMKRPLQEVIDSLREMAKSPINGNGIERIGFNNGH